MNDIELDAKIDDLLKESFDLIPDLFPDAEMRMRLTGKIPAMKSVTKKIWLALGARSPIDFCVLNAAVGTSYVAANPMAILECRSAADLSARMLPWAEKTLGIEFTEEDRQAREALDVITQKIAAEVNAKLSKLRHGR